MILIADFNNCYIIGSLVIIHEFDAQHLRSCIPFHLKFLFFPLNGLFFFCLQSCLFFCSSINNNNQEKDSQQTYEVCYVGCLSIDDCVNIIHYNNIRFFLVFSSIILCY